MFATFRHFLPSLIFTIEARSLPLERSPLRGSILALPNTLAYYNTATITAVKSFKVQAPELRSFQMTQEQNKGQNLHFRLETLTSGYVSSSEGDNLVTIL